MWKRIPPSFLLLHLPLPYKEIAFPYQNRTAADVCLLVRNLSLLPPDFRFGQCIFLLKKNVTFTRNASVQILPSDKHAQLPTEIKEVPEGKTWPQIRILIIVILSNPFPAKRQKWPILHNKFTDLSHTQYQGFC